MIGPAIAARLTDVGVKDNDGRMGAITTTQRMKKARRKLTAVEIDASDEADVHPETAVATGALEAHEGADGERPGRAALGRHDEGRPPRLALRAVRADLILRLGHEDLKALL